jgi:hypothetical protein
VLPVLLGLLPILSAILFLMAPASIANAKTLGAKQEELSQAQVSSIETQLDRASAVVAASDELEQLRKQLEAIPGIKVTPAPKACLDQARKDIWEALLEERRRVRTQIGTNAALARDQFARRSVQNAGLAVTVGLLLGWMRFGAMKEMEEDLKTIRQLLENLVTLSFAQEQNMKEVTAATINTPRYVELSQNQFKIKDDFRIVEDSLQALANRQFEISGVITEKVTEIKATFAKSLEELEERRVNTANVQQQSSMKSLNDLALLLAESMQNMQEQMASAMPGSQSCQKPGNKKGQGQGKGKGEGEGSGKGSPKDKMSKSQEDINKIMKDLKERLDKQGPGGPGGPGGSKPGNSREFAQLAAKQAALRNALRQLQKEKQEQGKGDKGLDEAMDGMDKIERELVNKRLTNEMIQQALWPKQKRS